MPVDLPEDSSPALDHVGESGRAKPPAVAPDRRRAYADEHRANVPSVSEEARATIRLAVPLALTQIGQVVMFTTDLMFIGRLGDSYLAAGALAHTILFAAFVLGMGLMSAVAPLTAQSLGANDPAGVRRSLRVGIHACIIIGIPVVAAQLYCEPLLLALGQAPDNAAKAAAYLSTLAWSIIPAWIFWAMRGYMSALDRPAPGLWIMLGGIPVNAALAYALVFGAWGFPELGLYGAGLATTVVNVAMCVAGALTILASERLNSFRPLDRIWRPDWPKFRELFRIGAPMSAAFTMEHGLFAAAVFMAGLIGTSALASHQIAMQIASLAFMVPLGISQAASVRVGYWFGFGSPEAARQAGWTALAITGAATALVMITTWVTAPVIPMMFLGGETPDNTVTEELGRWVRGVAACF
ncbi:MAG: MATE family efflux transporter, partial [Pseudomonadota bacterium]